VTIDFGLYFYRYGLFIVCGFVIDFVV